MTGVWREETTAPLSTEVGVAGATSWSHLIEVTVDDMTSRIHLIEAAGDDMTSQSHLIEAAVGGAKVVAQLTTSEM